MSDTHHNEIQRLICTRMWLRDGWGRCHDTLPRKSPLQTYEEMLWRRANIANRRLWEAIQLRDKSQLQKDFKSLSCPNGDMRKACCSDPALNAAIQLAREREAKAWDALEEMRVAIQESGLEYGRLDGHQRGAHMRMENDMRKKLPRLFSLAQDATHGLVVAIHAAQEALTLKAREA